MELGTPGGNAGPSAKQKKSKKRRSRSSLQPCRKVASRDVLGEHRRLPRLRPLYQYINFDMPELMCPSEEKDETLGPAGTATGPELEGELPQETWASSALEVPTPALDDKPRQVDTETTLGCTAYLVSPLFIRYPHKLSASCVTTTAWHWMVVISTSPMFGWLFFFLVAEKMIYLRSGGTAPQFLL
nr:uncharacterized protein C16orf86 homolog isoform X3 [Anas platyrhynchos]